MPPCPDLWSPQPKRRPSKNWGLRGDISLGWPLIQGGIPAAERRLQFIVQDARAYLKQQMRPARCPSHLLLLDHPFADHLIDGRLRERRRDHLAIAPALAAVPLGSTEVPESCSLRTLGSIAFLPLSRPGAVKSVENARAYAPHLKVVRQ